MNLSASNLIGGILFGSIGFVAFLYGKKTSNFKPLLIGIALIMYPYFIQDTVTMYVIGVLLTASLYFFRD